MLGYIGFGIVDNGVLIFGAVAGFNLEDIINNGLDKLPYYRIQTRIKGLSSTLLGAGISNAISDLLGGFCVSWQLALGTCSGCLLAVIVCLPFIFKIERKPNARNKDQANRLGNNMYV